MKTGKNITVEQIRGLRDEARKNGDYATAQCCTDAEHHGSRRVRRESRARCAELLNALAVSPTAVTCGYEPCDGGPCEYPVEHAAREAEPDSER